MIVAISGEATAAIVGAVAGGAIALAGQALVGAYGAVRARRLAAQLIFGELLSNYATASSALEGYGWTATREGAIRTAWDTYGARLLRPWHRAHYIGPIVMAYNRVDDIAFLAASNSLDPTTKDYREDILLGLYIVGRAAGYSDGELEARTVPVTSVRAALDKNEQVAREARRVSRRLRWKARRDALRRAARIH